MDFLFATACGGCAAFDKARRCLQPEAIKIKKNADASAMIFLFIQTDLAVLPLFR